MNERRVSFFAGVGVLIEQPRARPPALSPSVQGEPFRLGEILIDPCEKGLEQTIGPERRTVRKNPAELGQARPADVAARNALREGIGAQDDVPEFVPEIVLIVHIGLDFVGGEAAA